MKPCRMTTVNTCSLPNTPADLHNQHIVIWGIGSYGGGLGSAQFCAAHGASISILELKSPSALPDAAANAEQQQWPWHVGDANHSCLKIADLIICSPAIPPRALPQDPSLLQKITNDLSLFFQFHSGPRLGISGTKGKSSTANMCSALLDWPVLGNSHQSVLQFLLHNDHNDPVVLELSSFQLWYLQNRPFRLDAGIITNIDRDHLDWHESLEDYQASKQILKNNADICINTENNAVQIENGYFIDANGTICERSAFPIRSPAQEHNACLALSACIQLGMSRSEAASRLATFTGLPHRYELVHQCQAIQFINDSAATTPIALLDALQRLPSSDKMTAVVILGGYDKGGDFSDVASHIQQHQISCVLLGDAAATLSTAGIHGPICESLESAMETAMQGLDLNQAAQIVLSPGCASFGLFSSYIERGERFGAFARLRWPDPSKAF